VRNWIVYVPKDFKDKCIRYVSGKVEIERKSPIILNNYMLADGTYVPPHFDDLRNVIKVQEFFHNFPDNDSRTTEFIIWHESQHLFDKHSLLKYCLRMQQLLPTSGEARAVGEATMINERNCRKFGSLVGNYVDPIVFGPYIKRDRLPRLDI
jgi:hypothetical protein